MRRQKCALMTIVSGGFLLSAAAAQAQTWSTAGAFANHGLGTDYQVDAELVRTNKSTGISTIIKTFDSSSFATTGPTAKSISFTHPLDFTNYAYFITMPVTRADTSGNPGVWYVQTK